MSVGVAPGGSERMAIRALGGELLPRADGIGHIPAPPGLPEHPGGLCGRRRWKEGGKARSEEGAAFRHGSPDVREGDVVAATRRLVGRGHGLVHVVKRSGLLAGVKGYAGGTPDSEPASGTPAARCKLFGLRPGRGRPAPRTATHWLAVGTCRGRAALPRLLSRCPRGRSSWALRWRRWGPASNGWAAPPGFNRRTGRAASKS
jgi:hypothetical protein